MNDRINKLSQLLTAYSCELKKDERLLIEYEGETTIPLVRQLIKNTYELGAKPYLLKRNSPLQRELLLRADEDQLQSIGAWELAQMKIMDAYIGIWSDANVCELSDVPEDGLCLYEKMRREVVDYRTAETKWVAMKYPNPSMAQLASMSEENFESFFFDVCTMDYQKMSKAMDALVDLMGKTDKVRIWGEGTNLSFSIKGMNAIKCDGHMNIPDGEVYTAPVRDSVNGKIRYNVDSHIRGFTHCNIEFEVVDGRIVRASSNDCQRINNILDTDEGSRYFGEFALGVNPYITMPMNDILFDEKICGSFHLTPGSPYEDADNGNKSSIHWDLVSIQRPEYGGGEIWFDDVLIRKDGFFVVDELKGLNPKELK